MAQRRPTTFLLALAALGGAVRVSASAVSTSVFPNAACHGATSSQSGLVGIGKIVLSSGEVETHCGCPSDNLPSFEVCPSSAHGESVCNSVLDLETGSFAASCAIVPCAGSACPHTVVNTVVVDQSDCFDSDKGSIGYLTVDGESKCGCSGDVTSEDFTTCAPPAGSGRAACVATDSDFLGTSLTHSEEVKCAVVCDEGFEFVEGECVAEADLEDDEDEDDEDDEEEDDAEEEEEAETATEEVAELHKRAPTPSGAYHHRPSPRPHHAAGAPAPGASAAHHSKGKKAKSHKKSSKKGKKSKKTKSKKTKATGAHAKPSAVHHAKPSAVHHSHPSASPLYKRAHVSAAYPAPSAKYHHDGPGADPARHGGAAAPVPSGKLHGGKAHHKSHKKHKKTKKTKKVSGDDDVKAPTPSGKLSSGHKSGKPTSHRGHHGHHSATYTAPGHGPSAHHHKPSPLPKA